MKQLPGMSDRDPASVTTVRKGGGGTHALPRGMHVSQMNHHFTIRQSHQQSMDAVSKPELGTESR